MSKYVNVNGGSPGGGFVLVDNDADGGRIKREAKTQGIVPKDADPGLLTGHNCNGSATVIGDNDVPWQHDFSLSSIFDNA